MPRLRVRRPNRDHEKPAHIRYLLAGLGEGSERPSAVRERLRALLRPARGNWRSRWVSLPPPTAGETQEALQERSP
ncbi:MAG: hypothetical protein RML46_02465 [Anaerolineae bacterium]|nr:hypothetical protein [Anaerolineae bacterium]